MLVRQVYVGGLSYDGYAVYDAAYRRFNDCTVEVENFDDFGDELMKQLDYGGYDFREYIGLSDLHGPAASRCRK